MHCSCKCYCHQKLNQDASFGRIAPDRELHWVGLNFCHVFQFKKRLVAFDISYAVPILPNKHMIRACTEYGVLSGVSTSPDFLNYVLSELRL